MWARVGSGGALIALQAMLYFSGGPFALLASLSICSCVVAMRNAREACESTIRNVLMYSAALAMVIVLTAWTVYSLRSKGTSGFGLLIALSMGFTLNLMGHRFSFFEDATKSTKNSADASEGRIV